MPLLGQAAVAMWWDMAPEHRAEFEDWHSHEHFPERMSIPGFLRGSRWADASGGEGFFVLYELDVYATLTSPAYRERLDHPTPWSTKMMPHHRRMVRSQCRALASHGGGVARWMATTRLAPEAGRDERLLERLRARLREATSLPGITGGHLLPTETPEAAETHEQRIRGSADAVADWILLVGGYDAQALDAVMATRFGEDALATDGARRDQLRGIYGLAYTMTPRDR